MLTDKGRQLADIISAIAADIQQVLFSFYGRKIEDALPYTRPGKPFTLFLVRGQGYGDKAHRKAQRPPRGWWMQSTTLVDNGLGDQKG